MREETVTIEEMATETEEIIVTIEDEAETEMEESRTIEIRVTEEIMIEIETEETTEITEITEITGITGITEEGVVIEMVETGIEEEEDVETSVEEEVTIKTER